MRKLVNMGHVRPNGQLSLTALLPNFFDQGDRIAVQNFFRAHLNANGGASQINLPKEEKYRDVSGRARLHKERQLRERAVRPASGLG